ncbi:MAG: hypothetical protein K1X57_08615 [Gemmataceae bacterium]|nr:hypothetical protein [Gemmataceae bacterium]
MTEDNQTPPKERILITIIRWETVDEASCRYRITVDSELADPGNKHPVFTAIGNNKIIAHNCDDPSRPLEFVHMGGIRYQMEMCLCGVGPGERITVVVSDPISDDPANPSNAATFSVMPPGHGCPACPEEDHKMPAAARTVAPAAKAAKPAKAKPAKKPAPKKPAKPAKKVVAKKPAPKKPAKPAKKKPGRRK